MDAGHQTAAVWLDGALSWGPRFDACLRRGRVESGRSTPPLPSWAPNRGEWIDPFAELGLHVERSTEGLAHPRAATG